VVLMQPGMKVSGAYYCDDLLLKHLLPDICQAVYLNIFYFESEIAPRVTGKDPNAATEPAMPNFV